MRLQDYLDSQLGENGKPRSKERGRAGRGNRGGERDGSPPTHKVPPKPPEADVVSFQVATRPKEAFPHTAGAQEPAEDEELQLS